MAELTSSSFFVKRVSCDAMLQTVMRGDLRVILESKETERRVL